MFRLFVGFALSCALAWEQNVTLTGTITDPDGGAVKSPIVQVKNSASGATSKTTGSAKGEFRMSLPPGTYDIAFPLPCCQYSSFKQAGVALRAGESRKLDIRVAWGSNLGAIADDPILLLDAFRDRASVPSGRAPRTHDGKPDLSGMWINVYNPDTPPPPLKSWADELHKKRMADDSKDYPGGYCLPPNASSITRAFPYKFVQTSSLIVVIHESDTPGLRQIFLDGRSHPKEWNPTWQGHSIGRWERDTLVVDTTGFNDKAWLSLSGITHSEKLHVIERIRRRDLGHLEVEITMEDSDAFTTPWKRSFTATLAPPGEEILEYICNENNTDPAHYRAR